MNDHVLATFCLALSGSLALTSLASFVLERARVPPLIGALLVGCALRYTPLARMLHDGMAGDLFELFAQFGLLLLLFFVGLQIDLSELRKGSRRIALLTASSTLAPFTLVATLLLILGYETPLAVVVGLTLMPTAEIVVVPILDEFDLLHTRVGSLIIAVGTLDDIVEVMLVAMVSIWLARGDGEASWLSFAAPSAAGVLGMGALAWSSTRFVLPRLERYMPTHAYHVVMASMFVLLAFVGLTTMANFGPLIGALTAGLVMQPTYARVGVQGERAAQAFRQIGFGFFGALFFLRVGFNVDSLRLLAAPWLALGLFAAAGAGKVAGVVPFAAANRLSLVEAVTMGIGLDARLTTEIIVAQLLFHAGLIPVPVFDALVAASALATISVPIAFSLLMRKWGGRLVVVRAMQPARSAAGEPR